MVKMSVAIKIARICLTSITAAISVFFIAGVPAMADAVHVEIQEGDTSFFIDKDKGKIWWIKEECRYEIPISKNQKKLKKHIDIVSSDKFTKNVQIGSHRFTLEQQFRFDMVSHVPTLQVFNSARGGWSEIPVRINDTCSSDLTCRLRMELPLCSD
jgi:hypothetical protein